MTFLGVGERCRVGDQLGVAGDDGVDDAQACSTQCPTGFGEIDNTISNVRNLGFTCSVRKPHVGLNAVVLEELLRESRVFARHSHASRQVGDFLELRVVRHRHHDANRVVGGLGVVQFAERFDDAPRLFDPITTGDADVKEPFGDVRRNLLRPQDAHFVDARVGN